MESEPKRLKQSLRNYRRLLVLEPGHIGHLEHLARLSLALGRAQEAAHYLADRAAQLEGMGAPGAALLDCYKALQLAPRLRPARALRERLEAAGEGAPAPDAEVSGAEAVPIDELVARLATPPQGPLSSAEVLLDPEAARSGLRTLDSGPALRPEDAVDAMSLVAVRDPDSIDMELVGPEQVIAEGPPTATHRALVTGDFEVVEEWDGVMDPLDEAPTTRPAAISPVADERPTLPLRALDPPGVARDEPDALVATVERLLGGAPLFGCLSVAQRRGLAGRFEPVGSPAGACPLGPGARPDGLFIVAEGTLELRRAGRPPRALGVGAIFGVLSELSAGDSAPEVIAGGEVRLFFVGAEALSQALEHLELRAALSRVAHAEGLVLDAPDP